MATERDIEAIFALSPLQQGLLFHTLLDPSTDPYFIQTGFTLQGPLQPDVFAQAWSDLIERHAILRTGFAWRDLSRPVQVVRRQAALRLRQEDWRQHGAAEQERRLAAWLRADREQSFDLLKPPLLRLALFRRAEQAWSFLISHHHLLLDGWSFARVLGEALESYESRRSGRPLPEVGPRSFRDYLGWLEAQSPAQAEHFFRDQLAQFSRPTPLPFAAAAAAGAAGYSEHALSFSVAETRALSDCARRLRVTLNTLLQGAWALLLARHAGEREVVFGTTVSGRPAELAGADSIIGLLINTLPVRVQVDPAQALGSWLQQLQLWNGELRQYEWAPLARIQGWSGVPNGRALFDSVVVFDSYPEPEGRGEPGGIEIRALDLEPLRQGGVHPGRNNYPLSLIVEPNAELRLVLSHQTARLEAGAGRRLLEQCRTLLLGFLGSPERRLGELSWGEGVAPYAQGPVRSFAGPSTVHGLFDWHVAQSPDAPAVVSERESLSYAELQARAACLAEALRARGVAGEERVALLVERSAALTVGIFGVLKAGAAYVPIDPRWPAERAAQIVADSGARVLVYGQAQAELALQLGVPAVCLEQLPRVPAAAASASVVVQPERAAYLIYTSGSTGRPKGVVVEHRQLVNYVLAVLERLRLEPAARLGLVSTVAADLGHTSLFGALCSGRTLQVVSDERTFDPTAFAEHLERAPLDALKIVPSHLHALLEAERPERALPRSCLVIGGETAPRGLLERVRALRPECRVVNHYGPTETTVGALTWELAVDQPPGPLPIGRPIANLRAYVLDDELRPVPEGVPGELYLGGAGVARGYHQRPGLTAERFIPDPHDGAFGQRLYRTGDRARRRSDGAIEFLGRTDHQIKLRGHRIELGEIEAALCETGAQQAVVLVRSAGGADRLVAYVVPRQLDGFSSEAVLRELGRRLPDYMLPSQIVALGQLPLTRNGKIDRAALPEPEAASARVERVAPRNELEATLAQIWSEILQQPEVGVHDNFFALGGDSIRSLQVLARARQRGVELTPRQLLEQPTIAALAELVTARAQGANDAVSAPAPAAAPSTVALAPAPEATTDAEQVDFPLSGLTRAELTRLFASGQWPEDLYPLSPMQEGMLFHTLLSPGSGIYLMQQHYTWSGPLDRQRLLRSWQRVVERHPILRTRFLWRDLERPLQAVERSIDLSQVLLFSDLRALSPEQQEAQLRAELEAELKAGLALDQAPLLRLRVARLERESYRIVRSFHHILTDDWCFSVMMMECLSFYQALERGEQLQLLQPRPYRDYIAWLGQRDLAAAERFWREELAGFSAATPLGIEQATAGSAAESVADEYAQLSLQTSRSLRNLAERHSLTPNTFVQGAWALLLRRYSGQDDVVFGVTVAGRPPELPGVENILGLFINSLPLRVLVQPERPLLAWLSELLAHNYRIREFEYPPLVEIQRWSELPQGQPLFHSLLVFENAPQDPMLGQQVEEVELGFEHDRVHTNYPLTLVAYPGEQFGLRLSYDNRLLAAADVQRLLRHLCQLLVRMAETPNALIGNLEPLSDAEQRALLTAPSHAAPVAAPPLPSYVALFAARVSEQPEAIAVSSRGRSLSYAELDRESNRVAFALRAQGVRRDTLVAVLDTRDVELLVAALGVLKAGGAYLPLDPSQPPERWRQILTQSRAPVIWTNATCSAALAQLALQPRPRVLLRESLQREPVPASPLSELIVPQQLAYAIFTSGSTGVPKGALIEHAGMLNNVWGKLPALALSATDVIGQTASQCFDISVWQLLSGLLAGARVHIVPDEVVADPERLVAEAARERITVLELVPSLLREVCDVPVRLPALRWLLPTGEALPPELCSKWFAAHPGVPLMNAYGPAECSDDVALYTLTAAPEPPPLRVPIGYPVPNTWIHVVSADGLAPPGVAGELCVAGVGVGRGYLNDPVRTALAFVPDPYSGVPGSRLYRTGDLGLRRADGCLEFVGRRDQQVKVRGYRIELGEIEARLGQHPAVREVAVLAERAGDGNRLIAFVSTIAGVELAREQLQGYLRQSLPEYMVPASMVFLPALPLTPNGKVDRRALAGSAQPEADSTAAATPPRSELEAAVVGIWQEVLGCARAPGIFANFFDLGGHSLLATRVMSRVRARFRIELPLRALFEAPTAAEFTARVALVLAQARSSRRLPPLVAGARPERLPLSFAQRGLWFEQQLPQPPGAFVIPFLLELQGELQPQALQQALQGLLQRHEILRTAFLVERGEPYQLVLPELRLELPLADLAQLAAGEVEATLALRMAAIQSEPFDLSRPPLLRAQLFRLAPERHALALALHHIVADAWSIALLVRELMDGYRLARSANATATLPMPALQYADYALWQRQPELKALHDAQLAYWKQRLAGAARWLTLPGQVSGAGGTPRAERLRRRLPQLTAGAVAKLAERQSSTPFLVLGAALAVLIQQQTGATELCIGTDVAGRPVSESEGIVGFFVNQLVLRVAVQPELTFRELLAAHTRSALEAYEHQELPFERLVAELGARRGAEQPPLFQLKLLMENAPQRDLQLDGLAIVERELPPGGSEVDLLINAQLTQAELELVFDYRRDLYAPDYVTQLADLYAELLSHATRAPERRVEELVAALHEHQAELAARARAEQQARLAQARSTLGAGARRTAVRVPESPVSDSKRNPSDV